MADTFEDLGIAPELVEGANALGWEHPTALQKDAVPVLRRGNNGVLHASTGAGVTGAWALALLDRLASLDEDDDGATLALVLAPSSDEVARTAAVLARLGASADVSVRAMAPGWAARPTRIVVATPGAALAAVKESALKLDAVAVVVISGADRILSLGEWDAVQTLTETATSAGQKILVTGAFERPIEEFMDRHVRKALTIPPRPDGDPQQLGGSVRYALAGEADRVDALVALLTDVETGEVAIVCRTASGAGEIARELAARGVPVEGITPAGETPGTERRVLVLPAAEADRRSTRATVLSADPPYDAATLTELHGTGGTVLATPAELPHLRRIGQRAGLRLQPVALPAPGAAGSAENAREAVRVAIREVDLAAYLALVQPLLEEHTAPEVAAAALYLARNAGATRPRPDTMTTQGSGGAVGATTRTASGSGGPPPSTAFVRLFITAGERDDVTPGDLVGAITGEAGVEGETVGRIDIRESHSTVEVASSDADRVIQALNGRTLKGRSLRVDYDRKDRVTGPGGAAGGRSGGASGGRGPGGRSGPGGPKGGPRTGGRGGDRPGGSRPGGKPGGSGGSRPGGSRTGGGGRSGGPRSGGPGGSRPPGRSGGSRPGRGGRD